MLSKEDYLKYLDQMEAIEAHMIDVYSQCLSLVDDGEMKNEFVSLIEAEKRHSRMVVSAKNLFL
jgi:rubrerythrin